jgi:hypothetical protein
MPLISPTDIFSTSTASLGSAPRWNTEVTGSAENVPSGRASVVSSKCQAARRVALGLPGHLEDMSIMTTAEADAYREELIRNLTEQGFDEHRLFENSFDDITDFK